MMALEFMVFFYFVSRILAFRIKLIQEDIPFAGDTENCQNESTVGTGCPAPDNAKNYPLNISVGNVKDHLLNAGCSLVLHWQLVPFKAIVLAFMIWQLFPLVIELLSAAGKMNHDWHVVLNAGCLFLIHWQLVPVGAFVIAFFVWHFLPFLIGSTEAKGKVSINAKRGDLEEPLSPIILHVLQSLILTKEQRYQGLQSLILIPLLLYATTVQMCMCAMIWSRTELFKLQQLEVITIEPIVLALLFGNGKMIMARFTLLR